MIGLCIPWVGTKRDAAIIAAIRDGQDAGRIEREHRISHSEQLDLYARYVERCVQFLRDRLNAQGLRAALRDHVLELIARFYPAAVQGPNIKAAQMVIAAVSLYARLDKDHAELDRQAEMDERANNPDDVKRSPEYGSERRQNTLQEIEDTDGLPVPEAAKLAHSMILTYQQKKG